MLLLDLYHELAVLRLNSWPDCVAVSNDIYRKTCLCTNLDARSLDFKTNALPFELDA